MHITKEFFGTKKIPASLFTSILSRFEFTNHNYIIYSWHIKIVGSNFRVFIYILWAIRLTRKDTIKLFSSRHYLILLPWWKELLQLSYLKRSFIFVGTVISVTALPRIQNCFEANVSNDTLNKEFVFLLRWLRALTIY